MYTERTASTEITRKEWPGSVTGRILIVDGHCMFSRCMLDAFAARGYQVDWTATVRDGLGSLARARYDVAIVDLRLDDGSGLDLLERASEQGLLGSVAAVLVTSHDFDELNGSRTAAVDLERFLDEVSALASRSLRREDGSMASPASAPLQILLVQYTPDGNAITPHSPASAGRRPADPASTRFGLQLLSSGTGRRASRAA